MVFTQINEQHRAALAAAGLLDLEAAYQREDLTPVKSLLAVRQTLRWTAPDGTTYYIKRYHQPPRDPFFELIGARRFASPASREFAVLQHLATLNIPAPEPVACLEEKVGRRINRAVLITRSLPQTSSLEEVFHPRRPDAGDARDLAERLGHLTRTMHDGGINHRDYYFIHLKVSSNGTIFVTDLNRAGIRRHVGRRWRVKDLAALLQSAPPSVRRTDMARFARAYFGGPLDGQKRFIRSVLRKAARMKARTLKRIAEGHPNYHTTD